MNLKTISVGALGLAMLATPAFAQTVVEKRTTVVQGRAATGERVESGVLNCDVSGGVGLVLGSQKTMVCTYRSGRNGRVENYVGKVTRLGLDLGVTGPAKMSWVVYAPTRTVQRGALAGTYSGVSADASLGAGAGANALLGGSQNTIQLQPLSVQAQTGVNVAAGIAGLNLQPAR